MKIKKQTGIDFEAPNESVLTFQILNYADVTQAPFMNTFP